MATKKKKGYNKTFEEFRQEVIENSVIYVNLQILNPKHLVILIRNIILNARYMEK